MEHQCGRGEINVLETSFDAIRMPIYTCGRNQLCEVHLSAVGSTIVLTTVGIELLKSR